MNIFITGAAGFLGSNLVDQLLRASEEHRVVGLDNLLTGQVKNLAAHEFTDRFAFVQGDVTKRHIFHGPPAGADFHADQIYHLACPASPVQYQKDPVGTIRTCVEGTLRVLEMAQETGARLLIASTSEVYGDPAIHPQPESYWGNTNPIGPRACYDEGKRCAEALAVSFAQQYGVEVRIARIFNTYGPKMAEDDGRVVSNLILQALKGEPMTLFGEGMQTRSFCYVDDLVRGLVALMASDEDMPVNLGNPEEITMHGLAELILRLTQSSSPIVHRPLPVDDPLRRKPDITKAKRVLGWEPSTSLVEGLAKTIAYFRQPSST